MDNKKARIITGDVVSFARHYGGEPFHAMICDAPYHLTTITNRFGNEDAAPAQYGTDGAFQRASKGFMGQTWDGGDVAFRPETWRAFWDLLYPGAFGMTFGGSRTAHRMAVAIEDAGYIIHPMMGWIYGSGFPKATRIDTQIDKALGDGKPPADIRITAPITELAKTWEGHRYGLQAQKPAMEPIIVFQKPYEGRPVDDITRTGAGALNIEGGKITANKDDMNNREISGHKEIIERDTFYGIPPQIKQVAGFTQGRWPANFIIQHTPECKRIGTTPDGYTINRFTEGAKPFGDAVGEDYEGEEVSSESVVWECAEGCPARELDRQSGGVGGDTRKMKSTYDKGAWGSMRAIESNALYNDSGGASRFFFNADYTYEKLEQEAAFKYMAKTGNNEREKGLIHHIPCAKCGELNSTHHINDKGEDEPCKRNVHPTIKTIGLIKHLATLLLPPDEYAPRRIFVPFAGTGSEMIGSFQAGWECIIGVEFVTDYVDIARARLDYWLALGIQQPLF